MVKPNWNTKELKPRTLISHLMIFSKKAVQLLAMEKAEHLPSWGGSVPFKMQVFSYYMCNKYGQHNLLILIFISSILVAFYVIILEIVTKT